MTLEEIRLHCLSFPGTTEGIKWGSILTFMVGGKLFAAFAVENTPLNASFKVSDEDFETMSEREGMKPAPYFAKNIWIAVDDIGRISEKEWKTILSNAYTLIKEKLPPKVQENL